MAKKFYESIKNACDESQVADVYNSHLKAYFKVDKVTRPCSCDGFIEAKTKNGKDLRLLIEYKKNLDFNKSTERAKVLIQAIFYLKNFDRTGEVILPNAILIADINECFVIHTNDVIDYLKDETIDWNISPSTAADTHKDIVLKLAQDEKLNPYVFTIDDDFSFSVVAEQIVRLADEIKQKVLVTERNIYNIYDYFTKRVVKHSDNIDSNDLVASFIGTLTNKNKYYQHPNIKNILVANGKEISIDRKNFEAFFNYYNTDYNAEQRNIFASIADRLVEITKRRKHGEYYTPTIFADYAHKMLNEQFGENWKDKYIVWDCCWGTGNLTRDYNFKELYISNISDSEMSIGCHYNQNSEKFVFDFLNDPIDDLFGKHIPSGLLEAFTENKPIIFFINPPYSISSGFGNSTKGKGACETSVYKQMVQDGMGNANKNLYVQFLYRIIMLKQRYNLSNLYLGLYSPTIYLSGGGQVLFREKFLKEFEFVKAIQFSASHFADVKDSWGIAFSIWKCGETIEKHKFNHILVDIVDENIQEIGEKVVYNTDGYVLAKQWARDPVKNKRTIERPTLSNAITVKYGKNSNTKISEDAMGCYFNAGNNVDQNPQYVALFTSCDNANAMGMSICKENFERVCALFASRRLVTKTWINCSDEYLEPNVNHKDWQEYENDSIVFSLFENKSKQSSLRQVEFKGKKWDIKNDFFFMSRERVMQLANDIYEIYEDARIAEERFVYKKLQSIKLSKEAQAVLDKAIELTEKSFKYRTVFNDDYPEYQILNWDCGWYQIKALLKQYMPKELKEFDALFKHLSNKMRPMVYELGFLK